MGVSGGEEVAVSEVGGGVFVSVMLGVVDALGVYGELGAHEAATDTAIIKKIATQTIFLFTGTSELFSRNIIH